MLKTPITALSAVVKAYGYLSEEEGGMAIHHGMSHRDY